MNQLIRPNAREAGFTLIEVLVASGILVLAVGSVVTIGRAAIQAQDIAMERTQAYELAQEGLEITRQIRDTAVAQESIGGDALPNWDERLPVIGQPVGLVWDDLGQRWRFTTSSVADPVVRNGIEEVILGDGATTTHFFRTIEFLASPALPGVGDPLAPLDSAAIQANARRVVVTVRWQSLGEDHEVSATTLLTNWKIRG